jgi:hypothetical protein
MCAHSLGSIPKSESSSNTYAYPNFSFKAAPEAESHPQAPPPTPTIIAPLLDHPAVLKSPASMLDYIEQRSVVEFSSQDLDALSDHGSRGSFDSASDTMTTSRTQSFPFSRSPPDVLKINDEGNASARRRGGSVLRSTLTPKSSTHRVDLRQHPLPRAVVDFLTPRLVSVLFAYLTRHPL